MKLIRIAQFGLVLILFGFATAQAQKQGRERIDSLEQVLQQHTQEDTAAVILLYTIAFELHSITPVKSIEFGEKALALAERLNFTNGIIMSLLCTGSGYWEFPDYPKALDYFFRALRISEQVNNKEYIAISYNNIGNVYADQDQKDEALQYYLNALSINEKLKVRKRIARNLGNIGTIYFDKEDYIKALDFHTRALKIYEEIGEKRGIAITLFNIGDAYLKMDDYDRSYEYFTRAIRISKEAGEDITLMNVYGEMGKLFYDLAMDKTVPFIPHPLAVSGNKNSYLRKSIEYSLTAYQLGKQIPALDEVISWTQLLSDAYRELNDFKMSYYYLDSNRIFKDSVFTIEKEKLINNMSTRREMDVKENEIQIQNVRLEKASIQRIALAGGLLALGIILFVIYRSRRKSERVLLNMLPEKIAYRLKNKEKPIADLFSDASVVFIDIVEFTSFSRNKDPGYLVGVLTEFFTKMDELSGKHGMEKIKTIGDCYMAVCGLPEPVPDSLERTARFALESRDLMRSYKTVDGYEIRVRIGIDAGKVVAGVIGEKKFSYDLWGDVVNTASRMESHGISGEIQVTENVFHKLDGKFIMTERGEVDIKGKGKMKTWILLNPV